MTKPRICLLYTGGTIGMVREPRGTGYILRPPSRPEDLLNRLKVMDEVHDVVDLDFVELMNKDSTNMMPKDWTHIAFAIHERLDRGYHGFVVVHGTDTLHFTASALTFVFGENLPVPIVLTGAQTTPDVVHGDARVNLLRALRVACEDVAEVVVAFGDYLFRGCRVRKKDERRFDAFESPAEAPLGSIMEQIVLSEGVKRRTSTPEPLNFQPFFAEGIVQFSLIPGLEPDILLPVLENPGCQGIVLQSFGAGNVPTEGRYSFEPFIRKAVGRGIPVIITSQFPANSTLTSYYEPGTKAIEAGAIPTGDMTHAAATTKFRWVLYQVQERITAGLLSKGQKRAVIAEMMERIYVKEMTPGIQG